MFADVDGDLFSLVMMSIHQNPLNQIVAVLVSRDVNEWYTRTIRMSGGDNSEISLQEFNSANLQTFFDNLRGELIYAVAVGIGKNVVNDTTLVRRRTMLA